MKLTVKQVAEIIEGKVVGNESDILSGVAKIEEGAKEMLSFLSNPKYEHYIYETQSTAVIVSNDFQPKKEVSCSLIKVEDPYLAFAKLLTAYENLKPRKTGVHPTAVIPEGMEIDSSNYIAAFVVIAEGAVIGKNVSIHEHCYIGEEAKIGDGVCLKQGVKVHHQCVIGKDSVIHSGSVIGGDGFGFAPSDQQFSKIPQVGNVVIEEAVEIGSNCTIDRATMGSTIIRKGVKLDNLIQIAHNVEIGENTVIAAQVGVSGSTKIGKNNMYGGQVGIAGHLTIADDVKIGAQSGIAGHIKQKGITVFGSPALEISQYKRSFIYFKNLKKLYDKVSELEKKLKEKS